MSGDCCVQVLFVTEKRDVEEEEEAKYTCAVNTGQVPRSLEASRLFFNRRLIDYPDKWHSLDFYKQAQNKNTFS